MKTCNKILIWCAFSAAFLSLGLGTLAYPFTLPIVRGTGLEWVFPGILAVFIIASALILSGWIRRSFPTFSTFFQSLDGCLHDKRVILKGLLFSLVVQGVNILMVYVLSKGYGFDIPLMVLTAFLPIILTFSSLPISISGLGIREASFVIFLGAYGLKAESAKSGRSLRI